VEQLVARWAHNPKVVSSSLAPATKKSQSIDWLFCFLPYISDQIISLTFKDIAKMQDFIDQANKNGTILLDKGRCQFCGADYQKGIFECMDNYNNGIQFLDFNNSEHHISRFLSVDAHALQHPEIHGRWSNHFHLTRLNLILDKKQTWDYKKSPLLSNYLNVYKQNRPNEFLAVPKPLDRGKITAKDLTKATTSVECIEQIKKWADEVYHSWSSNHSIVSQIADGFLDN
jgi:hypothetical protein